MSINIPVPLDTFLHYALGLLEEDARTQKKILDVHGVGKGVVLDQMLEQLVRSALPTEGGGGRDM